MNFGFNTNYDKVEMYSAEEAVENVGNPNWAGFKVLGAFTLWKLLDNYIAINGLLISSQGENVVTEIGPGHTVEVLIPLPESFNDDYDYASDCKNFCQFIFSDSEAVKNKYSASLATDWVKKVDAGLGEKLYLVLEVKNNNTQTLTIAQHLGFSVMILQDVQAEE